VHGFLPAMVDIAHSGSISVVGALGMSADEFDNMPCRSSNIESVNELEMVCMSDDEPAEEPTVISNRFSDEATDFDHEQSTNCGKDFVLETGPCYEVETNQATDYGVECCIIIITSHHMEKTDAGPRASISEKSH